MIGTSHFIWWWWHMCVEYSVMTNIHIHIYTYTCTHTHIFTLDTSHFMCVALMTKYYSRIGNKWIICTGDNIKCYRDPRTDMIWIIIIYYCYKPYLDIHVQYVYIFRSYVVCVGGCVCGGSIHKIGDGWVGEWVMRVCRMCEGVLWVGVWGSEFININIRS